MYKEDGAKAPSFSLPKTFSEIKELPLQFLGAVTIIFSLRLGRGNSMQVLRHFKTITHHKWLVLQGCFRVGLYWQGLTHDLSKYSPTEFFAGVKYYQEGKRSPIGPEKMDKGYSEAWLHHKGRNKHHFEYWTDYSPVTRVMSPVKMPLKYVKEMFCDRVAASKIYMGKDYTDASSLEYFMRAKGKRIIHPETSQLLESLLVMLKEQGEEKTFDYLRNMKEY